MCYCAIILSGDKMSYFLKQTKNKKGTYLQIYEGYYSIEKKNTTHRSYKPIGYIHDLINAGLKDPLSHYKAVVEEMNNLEKNKKSKDTQEIEINTPEKNLGYFLLNSISNAIKIEKDINILATNWKSNISIYNFIRDFVNARVVDPKSKYKTYYDVVPKLFNHDKISEDQMYLALDEIGNEYKKIIEIYNYHFNQLIKRDTSKVYFDATNFYFEITHEDALRRKGPSKENKPNPLVGLGLMLDKNLYPLGMEIFPGNKSEKPIIREVINNLKQTNNISGKTVQVADKGLNCSKNIIECLENGDGYLFSKSIKGEKQSEIKDLLDLNKYEKILNNKGEIKCYLNEYLYDKTYSIKDENGEFKSVNVKEKRIISYNPNLAKKKSLEIMRLRDKAINLVHSQAKKDKYGECGKYVNFISTNNNGEKEGKIKTELNEDLIAKDLTLAGYNMLITSEINLDKYEIYSTYHNLWRIEESFRIMKSYLDARPVYVRNKNSIQGHFLLCYLSVFLFRIVQFNVLQNKFSSEKVIDFIRNFKIVKASHNRYINICPRTDFIEELAEITKLPLLNALLRDLEINRIINYKPIFSTRF